MTAYDHTLPTREVFGPVVQGEGPYTGRRASFIRLGHCNLHCGNCDTKQTWDTARYDLDQTCPPRPVDDVADEALTHDTPIVVISGGEPLMWQHTPAWTRLLRRIHSHATRPVQIHVETNGTIRPSTTTEALVAHFSVSPKLAAMGSADPYKRRIKPLALRGFADLAHTGAACLKIVCRNEDDVTEAAAFADTHGFPRHHLWIMPEGVDLIETSASAVRIANAALHAEANISPRLHLQLGIR